MRSARMRHIASDGPPAENGTTMVMGRDGKFWATATLQKARIANTAKAIFRIAFSTNASAEEAVMPGLVPAFAGSFGGLAPSPAKPWRSRLPDIHLLTA